MASTLFAIPESRDRRLCPPELWQASHSARYTCQRDERDLLSIHHPWERSRKGGMGEWSCVARPPSGWSSGQQLFVSFYQSDNYSGAWRKDPWLGAQVFLKHRFKQLLVNGVVVWESDVADDELTGGKNGEDAVKVYYSCDPGKVAYQEPYRVVDISSVAAEQMAFTFRVLDKVASTRQLEGDYYQRYGWSNCDPQKVAANFQTSVYFGDVALVLKHDTVRASLWTHQASEKRISKPADATASFRLTTARTPKPGFPVRSGVPIPQGMFRDVDDLALQTAAGLPVSCSFRCISRWRDGSIQWLLCEFIGSAAKRYRIVCGKTPRLVSSRSLKIRDNKRGMNASNGLVDLRFGKCGDREIFHQLTTKDGEAYGGMHLSMKLNRVGWRETFTSVVRSIVIESSNDAVAIFRVDGDMCSEQGGRFGPFRARFELWAGMPYLLGEWRVINESDQAMALFLEWSAHLALPDLKHAVADFGPCVAHQDPLDPGVRPFPQFGSVPNSRKLLLPKDGELSCRQEEANLARVFKGVAVVAEAQKMPGFVNVDHSSGGVVAAMRWFAEEFPKGLILRADRLSLSTLPESEGSLGWQHDRPQVRIGRGEAKTQVFALWPHSGRLSARDVESFNDCVQDAPRLLNQKWFIKSDALEVGPERTSPELTLWERYATPTIEETGINVSRLGHREYWDTAWMNNYRDRLHQGLMQFVETADSRWLRYFEACASHYRDVDIIHYCPEHPEWVGNAHGYGEDHTSAQPMSNIGLTIDGLLDHYLLAGCVDSLETARGLAEHILTCHAWARSAREVGWPLAQVTRWYEYSRDSRFLKKAQEFVEAAHAFIEPRRGTFIELHGSFSYRGAVPFMSGYLAFGLIRYHRITSDPHSLRLLQLLAAGLFAETKLPSGGFAYSPTPENNAAWKNSQNCHWNSLMGGLTAYLWFTTGRSCYAQQTLECYPTVKQFKDGALTPMCMLPTASWMLRLVKMSKETKGKL